MKNNNDSNNKTTTKNSNTSSSNKTKTALKSSTNNSSSNTATATAATIRTRSSSTSASKTTAINKTNRLDLKRDSIKGSLKNRTANNKRVLDKSKDDVPNKIVRKDKNERERERKEKEKEQRQNETNKLQTQETQQQQKQQSQKEPPSQTVKTESKQTTLTLDNPIKPTLSQIKIPPTPREKTHNVAVLKFDFKDYITDGYPLKTTLQFDKSDIELNLEVMIQSKELEIELI